MNPKLQLTLRIAGIYNLIWGAIVILFPNFIFEMGGIENPIYPNIWQSVGMVIGVYGIGYYMAARNYINHYVIVLVGYLGKVFGPLGIIFFTLFFGFPKIFMLVSLFNDIIWLIPFTIMLKEAYKEHQFKL